MSVVAGGCANGVAVTNHIIYAQGLLFCNGFVHYFLVLSNAQFSAGLSLGGPGDGLQLLGDIRWGREAQVFDSP